MPRKGLTLAVKRDHHPAPAFQARPDAREWKDGVKSWDSSDELRITSAVQIWLRSLCLAAALANHRKLLHSQVLSAPRK